MKFKFYFLFVFFTLLFLFYPGDSRLFHIFAYHRPLFDQKQKDVRLPTNPIPILKSPYYPPVGAEGIYVVDLPSFTPILERSTHDKFFPASTAKIITALVAMDLYKPDEVITVKRTFGSIEGQVMGLVAGEKITVENLLYGTLVHSGNDAAYALADTYGFEKFVALMNKKVESLHMLDTHFTNPAGLDDFNEHTSPFDLALAGRALLKNPLLKKIVATKEITIADVDYQYFHTLSNVNKLLGEIQGVGGLKTGYTENAGENLVSFYKKNGHQYIVVILKSLDRFADTKTVIGWIDTNIDYLRP